MVWGISPIILGPPRGLGVPPLPPQFEGTEGSWFQKISARFCSRQSFALEQLKAKQRKDTRFNQFIQVPQKHLLPHKKHLPGPPEIPLGTPKIHSKPPQKIYGASGGILGVIWDIQRGLGMISSRT